MTPLFYILLASVILIIGLLVFDKKQGQRYCLKINKMEKINNDQPNAISWVAVTEKLPSRMDEDYLVVVRNKNKEGGIPLMDIGNFTSNGIWVKTNTWETVVYWAELPKPPYL